MKVVAAERRRFGYRRIHVMLAIRAKGHFWLATRPDWVAEFSLVGALSSVKPLGKWWAAVPRERWPDHEGARAYLQSN